MQVSAHHIRLLRLLKDQPDFNFKDGVPFCPTLSDLDRLLAVAQAAGMLKATIQGWKLTEDGQAVLDFADDLSGKAVG